MLANDLQEQLQSEAEGFLEMLANEDVEIRDLTQQLSFMLRLLGGTGFWEPGPGPGPGTNADKIAKLVAKGGVTSQRQILRHLGIASFGTVSRALVRLNIVKDEKGIYRLPNKNARAPRG